jgi:hypothetical protein
MQVNNVGAVGSRSTDVTAWAVRYEPTPQVRADAPPPRVEAVAPVRKMAEEPPPVGGLPSSVQVLSSLSPADRAVIAGMTGYQLSPTGQVMNPGGIPPWSFIISYAERRRVDFGQEPTPEVKPVDQVSGGKVDVQV